ncbi:hypothetical protein [Pararhodonellum marinum]|uniref:hypothetical protein n=1 Tax=Pararhodonellum marinum TaxID=2755358 RepID=UPI00188F17B6|nr:hypothetical protein [Pararhodonellum marinum]
MDIQVIKLELIEMLLRTDEESVLQKVKSILQNSSEKDFRLTEDDYKILDQRRERHISGQSTSSSWDEVKKEARSAVKLS